MEHPRGLVARWFRPPIRTLTVFVTLVGVLSGALGWLGWRVITVDRILEQTRIKEHLDLATERVNADLRRQIAQLELLSTATPRETGPAIPANVVVVRATGEAFVARPAGRLLFQPVAKPSSELSSTVFAEAEQLEYQAGNPAAAADHYRSLARSHNPGVKAGALVGLARVLRNSGDADGALQAYDNLARLDEISVDGLPAILRAHQGRASLLESLHRTPELRKEADAVMAYLWSGRHSLSPGAWHNEFDQARRRGASVPATPESTESMAITQAADWVFSTWLEDPARSGRSALDFQGRPALVMWKGTNEQLDVVIAGPRAIADMWAAAVAGQRVEGTLFDDSGRSIAGRVRSNDLRAPRTETIPGLPWSLHVASADDAANHADFAGRRRLYIVGLVLVALTLVASSYFIVRSLGRERDVARLQSEFVTAVSHEFRTPLTAIRQMAELLVKQRVPTDAHRKQTYQILVQESERLQRLVETLLDFGRVDAGTVTYRFESIDASGLVSTVVEEFRETWASRGFDVTVRHSSVPVRVHADRDAVGLALRNLLENACKYSGIERSVVVETMANEHNVGIRVSDRGIGIPAAEHGRIFERFVRGAAVRRSGIKGTGIGLALAREIVIAHHGDIQLESEVGKGSTFTILLPQEEA